MHLLSLFPSKMYFDSCVFVWHIMGTQFFSARQVCSGKVGEAVATAQKSLDEKAAWKQEKLDEKLANVSRESFCLQRGSALSCVFARRGFPAAQLGLPEFLRCSPKCTDPTNFESLQIESP